MTKKLTFITLIFCAISFANAQDTLLLEDFNTDMGIWVESAPSGDDQWGNNLDGNVWLNFDEDGIPDANARPGGWYWSNPDVDGSGGFCWSDSLAGGIMMSSSWLQNFDPGCSNWFISPAVRIDSNATLSWKSAPYQTPVWADGYSVWISTTDNLETSFSDMIFEAAEYPGTDNDTAATGDYALYDFVGPVTGSTTAWVHGADGMYTEVDTTDLDMTRLAGCLAPQSIDLSAYNGQTIYVAFYHGSHDDNILAIDDILITGSGWAVDVEESEEVDFEVFPNPATDFFKLTYELPKTAYVNISLYDNTGKLIEVYNQGTYMAGSHSFTADISKLVSGIYSIVIESELFRTSEQLIIK